MGRDIKKRGVVKKEERKLFEKKNYRKKKIIRKYVNITFFYNK